MAEKKSILEEALLDIKNIQSALNANTKEILRSVAREEIDGVVKESFEQEDDYEEEDLPSDDGTESGLPVGGDEEGIDGLDGTESEEDGLGDIESSEEVGPEMEPELGMDSEYELGGDDMDMTAASDDDVISIYKKLSGEDEIEIVGDDIHLTVTEPGEYVIKGTGAGAGATEDFDDSESMDDEFGSDDEDGVDYEIEMGDDEEGDEFGGEETEDEFGGDEEGEESAEAGETPEFEAGEEEEEEEDEEPLEEKISVGIGMSVGNHRNPTTAGSIGASENPKSKLDESRQLVSETTKKYNSLLSESKKLQVENENFRQALKEFRTKLVETVVFNSNLTYVTKLFMEHSTTKGEKQSIIKRFDNDVTNLIESKKLYKTITNELEVRKPISEALENKLTKGVTTSTSQQLNESTAYVDPSTKRIIDLMRRVENQ
jgi:hypothetical protein